MLDSDHPHFQMFFFWALSKSIPASSGIVDGLNDSTVSPSAHSAAAARVSKDKCSTMYPAAGSDTTNEPVTMVTELGQKSEPGVLQHDLVKNPIAFGLAKDEHHGSFDLVQATRIKLFIFVDETTSDCCDPSSETTGPGAGKDDLDRSETFHRKRRHNWPRSWYYNPYARGYGHDWSWGHHGHRGHHGHGYPSHHGHVHHGHGHHGHHGHEHGYHHHEGEIINSYLRVPMQILLMSSMGSEPEFVSIIDRYHYGSDFLTFLPI